MIETLTLALLGWALYVTSDIHAHGGFWPSFLALGLLLVVVYYLPESSGYPD